MCEVCGHPMLIHDEVGDAWVCTAPTCHCAFEIGLDGRPHFVMVDPE